MTPNSLAPIPMTCATHLMHRVLTYQSSKTPGRWSQATRRFAAADSAIEGSSTQKSPPNRQTCSDPGDSAAHTNRPRMSQRGEAATKGARVCDPQELCRPRRVLTKPARRPLPTCCGSQSRAPQNRCGPRLFRQILIECNSALR